MEVVGSLAGEGRGLAASAGAGAVNHNSLGQQEGCKRQSVEKHSMLSAAVVLCERLLAALQRGPMAGLDGQVAVVSGGGALSGSHWRCGSCKCKEGSRGGMREVIVVALPCLPSTW